VRSATERWHTLGAVADARATPWAAQRDVWIRGGDSEAQKDAFFVGGLVGIAFGILIYGV
jgi:hypothetical protein